MKHLTDFFRNNWPEIQQKMDAIDAIMGEGETNEGIEIDAEGYMQKSSTYYSGCGTDYFSFYVSWDEFDKPIEYFQEKKASIEANRLAEIEKQKEDKTKAAEKQEREEYNRLKKKFDN